MRKERKKDKKGDGFPHNERPFDFARSAVGTAAAFDATVPVISLLQDVTHNRWACETWLEREIPAQEGYSKTASGKF